MGEDPRPPTTFKHMERRFAEALLFEGRVRLRPLSAYRAMENAARGIEDPFEGRTQGSLDNFAMLPGGDEIARERLAKSGIVVGPNASAWFTGTTVHRQTEDCYIFSLTLDPTIGIFGAEYDAVVGLSDCSSLGAALQAAAPDHLGKGGWGRVRYAEVTWEVDKQDLVKADPFLKSPTFAWQREVRLVWKPIGPIIDPLDIQCEEIVEMFRRGQEGAEDNAANQLRGES